MNDSIPLPKYLWEHKQAILNIFEKEEPKVDVRKWLTFSQNDTIIYNDLKTIHGRFGGQITRSNLILLAKEALNLNWPKIRHLYLAIMMWGYVDWEIGKEYARNGLTYPEAKATLTATLQLVKNNKIAEAYRAFYLPRFRSAYFTKLFYFIGRACGLKPLPLILDSNVAKFLEFLDYSEKSKFLPSFVLVERNEKGQIISVSRYVSGYIRYISVMDAWAAKLECNADNIECFMYYERDKHLNKLISRKPNSESSKVKGATNMGDFCESDQLPISTEPINGILHIQWEEKLDSSWEFYVGKEDERNKLPNYPITCKDRPKGIKVILKNGENTCEAAFHGYNKNFYIGSAADLLGSAQTALYRNFLKIFGVNVGIAKYPIPVRLNFHNGNIVYISRR